jgi:hypothetical protein
VSPDGRRVGDERGTAATIVLFPLFAVVAFAFFQALLWQHDRQVAASVADRASAAVALYEATEGGVEADAVAELEAAGLHNVSVTVNRGDQQTVVRVSGDAPGILVGTSIRVAARSVTPTEDFQAP